MQTLVVILICIAVTALDLLVAAILIAPGPVLRWMKSQLLALVTRLTRPLEGHRTAQRSAQGGV